MTKKNLQKKFITKSIETIIFISYYYNKTNIYKTVSSPIEDKVTVIQLNNNTIDNPINQKVAQDRILILFNFFLFVGILILIWSDFLITILMKDIDINNKKIKRWRNR